ncbi:saccharopine dehydrogenase-like NADP-dependent oxidoreductase [Paenarthrobacter nitroguajacolicus]|uniref:saccharopine dehydrogenase n=1 Tax=Paenarthrobacter TaxID=1742992 RepID=UPI002861FA48|nr:saccharopine dehydrogenase [Paenarthrobacter nitroguajacolicus]MDR6986570.1 saccharopine dehydrogenase-like NADP-dependent oxidoreductase [Paenarthrobacter nitroguajacolicus]
MNDSLSLDATGPVLIVGGYGTVGTALTQLSAKEWPLLLTGRNPERGHHLASDTVALRQWDLRQQDPFAAKVRAVISTVNDPDDRVLRAAVEAGIPYVDVTRWTSRVTRAITQATLLRPAAPVLLSSGWMGGVTNIVAAALAQETGGADQVDVAIRYDTNDQAGADSVDFIDRLGLDFEVRKGGQAAVVRPLSDRRWVDIAGHRTKVARLDTPEQFTLPLTIGAGSVATRIGFSSPASTTALLAASAVGLFRWGSGSRWAPLRRSLLYSPGSGGTAHLRVDVEGPGGRRTAVISDPQGQAHLTALGGWLGLHSVLGAEAQPGVLFPESAAEPALQLAKLASHGVTILRS